MLRDQTCTGLLLMCLLLLVFASGVAQATQEPRGLVVVQSGHHTAPEQVYQNSWAVVIGINSYQHAEIPPLRYAVNDALSVQAALEPLGFPPQQIFTLLNEEATRHGIEQMLYDRLRGAQKEDRLFVFFAGHGKTEELPRGTAEGFLLPYDADPDNLFSTAISMSDVKRIGQRIAAKHILFVVDACYSGFAATRAVAPRVVDEAYLRLVTQAPAVQVITAGTAQEQAREEQGHGVFTKQFLQGLGGFADADWNGILTGAELATFLQSRVVQETEGGQTPQFGQLSGEGQFVFVLPQTEAPAALPVAAAPQEASPRAPTASGPDPEAEMWELVKNSSHPDDLTAFLKAYPNSRFAPAARLRLHQLQRQHGAPAAPEAPAGPSPSVAPEQQRLANDWYIRGKLYVAAENYADAMAAFTKVIELDPQHADAYRERGLMHGKLGDYREARRDFMHATSLNPQDAQAYRECGTVCTVLGDYAHAIQQLNRAIALEPLDHKTYTMRGIAYRNLSQYPQAMSDFNQALELNPQEAEAYRERGIAYGELGQHEPAMRDLNNAIRLAPQDAWAYVQRGMVYNKLANEPRALQNFARAIEMTNAEMGSSPRNARAYLHRGAAYALSGRYEEAIGDLDKAIELHPQFAAAYRERGTAYGELGNYLQALHDLDEAVQLNPFDASAYHQRGIVHGKLSNFLPAIRDFTKALELHPQSAATYRERGLIYKRLGNDQEAARDFRTADQLEGVQTR
jgi:tetratricopeptide (TPR) repeat protein/uncharacterized caspase-like protein